MTERKQPPPMYAVWNETMVAYWFSPTLSKELAERNLERVRRINTEHKFRIVTLIEQPEPPQ